MGFVVAAQEIACLEPLDLGGELRRERAAVKDRRRRDAALALDDTLPGAFEVVPQRRDPSHAGYDYPTTCHSEALRITMAPL